MDNLKVGDIVTGKVTGIEKYGVFLSFDNGVTGLIHISEISDSFVKSILDYVEMGELIKAKIIEIEDNGKLKLSIKNLDYRNRSKHSNPIVETPSGFSSLKNCLDKWIDDKLDIYNKNEKNNK